MKRIFLLSVMAAFVMVFAIGCDEDDAATNDNKVTGDLNDPVFLSMQGNLDEIESFDGQMFDVLFGIIDTVFDMAPGAKITRSSSHSLGANTDSVSVAYHANSGYWYAYASFTEIVPTSDTTADTMTVVIEDSVQFLAGAMSMQWPDSATLTAIKTGANVAATFPEGSLSANQNFTIAGEIVTEGDVTVNGTNGVSVSMGNLENCTFAVTMTGNATNVVLNLTTIDLDDCPTAGTLVSTGNINLQCTGEQAVSFNDTWTITETFAGEIITIVAENSTTRWTYTDTCSNSVQAKLPWFSNR